jgi:hypothetical protein
MKALRLNSQLLAGNLAEPLQRTLRGETEGFWLSVTATENFEGDVRGESTLEIWMEYEPNVPRFLGTLTVGAVPCHFEVFQLIRKDGEWTVPNDAVNAFLHKIEEGDEPRAFKIKGYTGDWVAVISSFAS